MLLTGAGARKCEGDDENGRQQQRDAEELHNCSCVPRDLGDSVTCADNLRDIVDRGPDQDPDRLVIETHATEQRGIDDHGYGGKGGHSDDGESRLAIRPGTVRQN
jgi:hypothetical protein